MDKQFLQLINRKHPLTKGQEPHHLVLSAYSEKDIYLHPTLDKQLNRLVRDLKLEDKIVVLDGYRTQAEQEALWEFSLEENGLSYTEEFVAYPGCSEHQTGLAIDLGLKGEVHDLIAPGFSKGPVVDLFLKEMMNYGFILRYPKNKRAITGIGYEPWHFRYVGLPHSQIISLQKWTLEEYHEFLSQVRQAIS